MTKFEQRLLKKPEVADTYRALQCDLADPDVTLEQMAVISAKIAALQTAHPECFPTAEENAAAEERIRTFGRLG